MRVVIGRIARAHGIAGEVAIDIRTDEPELRFAVGSAVWINERLFHIATSRRHHGRLLVAIAGINDRTGAEAVQGSLVEAEIDPDQRPAELDEFYDHQLIGLAAYNVCGTLIGHISAVEHPPAQDLLVLTVGDREVRVPFVKALVPVVDLTEGTVQIADVQGLLDLDEAQHAD